MKERSNFDQSESSVIKFKDSCLENEDKRFYQVKLNEFNRTDLLEESKSMTDKAVKDGDSHGKAKDEPVLE